MGRSALPPAPAARPRGPRPRPRRPGLRRRLVLFLAERAPTLTPPTVTGSGKRGK